MRQNESLPWDMPTSSGTRTALMAGRKLTCRYGSRCRNRSRRTSAHSEKGASPLRTERIAHLGTVDCCIPSTWAVRDDRGHAAENFFQGGNPKTGHPISPPGPPHRQKSFRPNFRGGGLDEFSIFARPPPRGARTRPRRRFRGIPIRAGPRRERDHLFAYAVTLASLTTVQKRRITYTVGGARRQDLSA